MINTKLIIVSGISGSGKSTTSKTIAQQLTLNNIPNIWLHEEIKDHPIRNNEFSIGDKYSEEDMDKNVEDMYARWSNLVNHIISSNDVYVIEGCLYQNIIRYFFNCNYPFHKIKAFYDSINYIIAPLKPTIVFLYKNDIEESFKKAFLVRGERWKNLILDPKGEGYFLTHPYNGEQSIYQMWNEYQEIANTMFTQVEGYKIKIDTSNGEWDKYKKLICDYLQIQYIESSININYNFDIYLGCYGIKINDRLITLIIKKKEDKYYCQSTFWTNMELVIVNENEAEFLSFPIKLVFNKDKSLTVLGDYGWMLSNKTLELISD